MSGGSSIRKALIPAAGLGTRMLPVTKAIPKEMLPLVNKPILQYAVEEAAASGLEEVILVTRPDKPLESYFTSGLEREKQLDDGDRRTGLHSLLDLSLRIRIRAVHQHTPSGLGDAIRCTRSTVGDEPFALILPDAVMRSHEPVIGQLLQSYAVIPGSYVATQTVEDADMSRFGMLDLKEIEDLGKRRLFRVLGLSEKPKPEQAPSRYGVFGRYLLEPVIFEQLESAARNGRAGDLQFAEALSQQCTEGRFYALCFEGRHFDAGDKLGYIQAVLEFALDDEEIGDALRDHLTGLTLPDYANRN